jgi:hypothetical protein
MHIRSAAVCASLLILGSGPPAINSHMVVNTESKPRIMSRTIPPSCVDYSNSTRKRNRLGDTEDRITVVNRCQDTQRVRTSYRYWFDGDCHVLSPGQGFTDFDSGHGFQGISSC